MKGVNCADERMETFEDLVNGAVATSAIPPTFNHSFVISVDCEVPASSASVVEVADKTFEANSFGPASVLLAVQGLPSWDEPPGPPPTMNNNCDADA